MSLINTQVQPFKAQAFHNGKFVEVTEASLKGKWSVLIFMPAVQLTNPQKVNVNGKLMIGFDLRVLPSSGNDELKIVVH